MSKGIVINEFNVFSPNLGLCLMDFTLTYVLLVLLGWILAWTLSLDFLESKRALILDCFSKMTYFIPCHKVDDASNFARLLLREIDRLYGLAKTIVADRDRKFVSHTGEHFGKD